MIDFVLYHTLILPPTCVSYNMSTNKKHKRKARLTCLHYQSNHQSNDARIRNLGVPLTSLLLYKCEWNLFWCKCLSGEVSFCFIGREGNSTTHLDMLPSLLILLLLSFKLWKEIVRAHLYFFVCSRLVSAFFAILYTYKTHPLLQSW